MPFSDKERTLAYNLLNLYQDGTFDWYDYTNITTGEVASVPFHQQIDFVTVKTRVDEILDDIDSESGNDGRLVVAQQILTAYEDIYTEDVEIRVGGTNTSPGVRYSTDSHEEKLRREFVKVMGVISLQNIMFSGAAGSGGGRNSMVNR